jgi:hypothetical protein
MRLPLPNLIAVLMTSLACTGTWAAGSPVDLQDWLEIQSHLVSQQPVVRTGWQDPTLGRIGPQGWRFRITVGKDGRVAQAELLWGPAAHRNEATRAVRSLRFRPFERAGQIVAGRFEYNVQETIEDYVGPPDRALPIRPDLQKFRVALARTSCYGSCPAYRVEVRGDGHVSYRGTRDVLVEGEHDWQITPEALARIVELVRRADYFKLRGYYVLDATDLPTYTTQVSFGSQQKFVVDYGGAGFDELEAMPGAHGASPRMPKAMTELEDGIDALSGANSWVRGDEGTMDRLRHAKWDFRAPAAGRALRMLIRACKVSTALSFIEAGAPIEDPEDKSHDYPLPALSARCGNLGLVRILASRGALDAPKDAAAFLRSSVAGGYPALVAVALQHEQRVTRIDPADPPLIVLAAGSHVRIDSSAADVTFDPAQVIAQLLAAGADIHERDGMENTALHAAGSGAVVRALIQAGAEPNARNAHGETPLFNGHGDGAEQALLDMGADVKARDDRGRTALFGLFYPEAATALLRAGADVQARDDEGLTPLETAQSEHVALVLLEAGARLPTDPDRLESMIRKATIVQWKQVLPALMQAKAAAGKPTAPAR